MKNLNVALVIPVFNEAGCIGQVVNEFLTLEIDGTPLIDEIVVVDHNSDDDTAKIACEAGATVINENKPGYGNACLGGIEYLAQRLKGTPDVVAFVDGDGSNIADDLYPLLRPLQSSAIEFVLGSRVALAGRGALTFQQQYGNLLACCLMRCFFRKTYTDLSPFRAIRWASLQRLGMSHPTYGWTVEMQIKAAKLSLPTQEIDVRYRPRQAGQSKVSGTFRGVVGASYAILSTIIKYR